MHKKQLNPRNLSFSQAQGYECLPSQLRLEELPEVARIRLWNLFHKSMNFTSFLPLVVDEGPSTFYVDHENIWRDILLDLHCNYFAQPIQSEASKDRIYEQELVTKAFKPIFRRGKFNEVFDLLTAIMRNEKCPKEYIKDVSEIFSGTRLAYFVLTDPPVTILPQATEQEGESIINAISDVGALGMSGAKAHLLGAGEAINRREWAESIRHSISAVESVARQLDPNASKTLGPALKTLKVSHNLHPALEQAFQNLYGYTSDEDGIRHARLKDTPPNFGSEEAIFMLGACVSFVTYLCSKHPHSKKVSNPQR